MYPLLKSLNDEWTDLVATNLAVEGWSTTCPNLSGRNLDGVLDWIAAEPDAALHFLISRAQNGDSVAARTVLQTMLGKLVLVSVQSARRGLTQEAAFIDLTGQMWVTVASYPLTARPRKIAANLWMDCAKQARRLWAYGQPDRRPEQTYSPEAVSWLLDHNITAGYDAATASADIRANDIIDSARHLGLITTDAADLLQSVYGPHGLSGNTASELWGISPAAVRTRCRRAIRLLADSADQLLAAA
jgi:DNA-directed RNA polymerase specialized sigma24 family protein